MIRALLRPWDETFERAWEDMPHILVAKPTRREARVVDDEPSPYAPLLETVSLERNLYRWTVALSPGPMSFAAEREVAVYSTPSDKRRVLDMIRLFILALKLLVFIDCRVQVPHVVDEWWRSG